MEVKHHVILLICLRCLTNFSCFLFFDGSDLRPYPGIQIWDPGPQMSKCLKPVPNFKFQISKKFQRFGRPLAKAGQTSDLNGLSGDILKSEISLRLCLWPPTHCITFNHQCHCIWSSFVSGATSNLSYIYRLFENPRTVPFLYSRYPCEEGTR